MDLTTAISLAHEWGFFLCPMDRGGWEVEYFSDNKNSKSCSDDDLVTAIEQALRAIGEHPEQVFGDLPARPVVTR